MYHFVHRATFVQRFSNFWVGVNSAVITDNMARFPLSVNPSQLVTPYITPCPEDLPQTSTTTSTTTTTTTPTTTTTTPSTTTTATTTTTTRPTDRVTSPWVTTPRQVLPTPAPATPPSVPKATSTPKPTRTTVGLDDKGGKCGTTRGCFSQCVEKDCTFNVQWRDMGDRVWFSLSVKVLPDTPDQWVALGMSHDTKMGDDSVVECLSQGGRRSMSISYNYQRSNRRMNPMNPVIFPISDTMADGVLTCEFVRAKMVPGNDKIYNLDKSWFMLVAQGPIVSGRMERHTNLPWVSRYRVDLKATQQMQVAFGDRIFIKVHACAMTFAWMFLASIAIVVARFYKPMWPQSRVCGRKLWFTIHRMCTMLLALLVVGAFVVIFLEVKGLSDVSDT
ncbi:putative ferric-chelate reductase 1 [Haliotis rubra]|uniref:putative ferric-chelate reductase 1 n=1 Tax=Haliotis rubra TaxID=36100 RepID=UPI001EE56D87|nr:putative ferric-chelate reductase 1 [Haliotis rubra]